MPLMAQRTTEPRVLIRQLTIKPTQPLKIPRTVPPGAMQQTILIRQVTVPTKPIRQLTILIQRAIVPIKPIKQLTIQIPL
jgi:hypothetical protein